MLFASLACAADNPTPPAAVAVKAALPRRGEILRYVTLPGTVKANQQATLYAKVGGYVSKVTVDKGDTVKAGQLLAELEVPELLADLKKLEAELKLAEIELKRLSEARAKAPDLVLPQALDTAQGKLEVARANVERTRTLLGFAQITAPFGGVITARFVDVGAFVPAATAGSAAGNAAALTLMDFSIVRVQVALPETDAVLAREGQPVKVTAEALPGRSLDARISRLAYALDDATKTMLVEADLPNPQRELRPGMYVTAKIGVEKHTGALLIPAEALVTEKAATSVFKLVDGQARKTPVKAGFNDGANVEVLSGLTENETVILVGKLTLTDGQPVIPLEAR